MNFYCCICRHRNVCKYYEKIDSLKNLLSELEKIFKENGIPDNLTLEMTCKYYNGSSFTVRSSTVDDIICTGDSLLLSSNLNPEIYNTTTYSSTGKNNVRAEAFSDQSYAKNYTEGEISSIPDDIVITMNGNDSRFFDDENLSKIKSNASDLIKNIPIKNIENE